MKKLWLVAAAIGMVIGVAGSGNASHSWENYHWSRPANPFTVRLVDSLSRRWDGLLLTVSSDWSKSTVLETVIQSGQDDLVTRTLCEPVATKVRVCNGYYEPSWLGLAQVWVDDGGDHIEQGIVLVNDTLFELPFWDNNGERLHVLCQEVGHTLGLGHQSETGDDLGTCMDYSSSTSVEQPNAHPNQHDYQQLKTIYTHLDGSGASGAASESARSTTRVWHEGELTVIQYIFWA